MQAIQASSSALGRVRRRGTKRQPKRVPRESESGRPMPVPKRFRLLFPISPLSTGLRPYFSLLRLGRDVHVAGVIGTAVPASPGTGNGKWMRQVTKGPISAGRIGRSLRVLTGPAGKRRRKSQSSLARRGSRISSWDLVSEAGRRRDRPKKGRRALDGFGFEGLRFQNAGPERSKDQRTFGPRSLVDRSGSSQEGAVR